LRELLRRYNEQPEQREALTAEIERRFRRQVAIMVVDCVGFTRTVRRSGIVHYLALLERLERLIGPLVEQAGGQIIRREADDFFATFADAPAAVRCADQIRRHLTVVNEALPESEEIEVAIGIGYGPVLAIGESDLYGDEMNLACKLGEDLAQRGEVLLTPAAYDELLTEPWQFETLEYTIAGLPLTAHRLVSGP
jgi:class 3 adenylate cyclase